MTLFVAIAHEDLEGVKKALVNGDNPNTLDAHGQAPLHIIATKSFRNAGTFPIILYLLEHKADVNLKNKEGLTALQIALQSGWQDTAAFLFEHGAEFDGHVRKATNIKCPDCLKVVESWEAHKFDKQHIPNYTFNDSKWNGHKGHEFYAPESGARPAGAAAAAIE